MPARLLIVLEILGIALVVAGVAAIHWPTSMMVAGAALLLMAWVGR